MTNLEHNAGVKSGAECSLRHIALSEPTDEVAAFTDGILRAGLMLHGLASDLIEDLAPDAFPGDGVLEHLRPPLRPRVDVVSTATFDRRLAGPDGERAAQVGWPSTGPTRTSSRTCAPCRSTKAGPMPLIFASSAGEPGRSEAIDSSVLLWATV